LAWFVFFFLSFLFLSPFFFFPLRFSHVRLMGTPSWALLQYMLGPITVSFASQPLPDILSAIATNFALNFIRHFARDERLQTLRSAILFVCFEQRLHFVHSLFNSSGTARVYYLISTPQDSPRIAFALYHGTRSGQDDADADGRCKDRLIHSEDTVLASSRRL
jgi:hypothetical protein